MHARAGEQASHDGVLPVGGAASLVGEICAAPAAVDLGAGGTGSQGRGEGGAGGGGGGDVAGEGRSLGGVRSGCWDLVGEGRGKWWLRIV
jgi:hypothetical protein